MSEEQAQAKLAQKAADDLLYLDRIGCAQCDDDLRHRDEVNKRIDKALYALIRRRFPQIDK